MQGPSRHHHSLDRRFRRTLCHGRAEVDPLAADALIALDRAVADLARIGRAEEIARRRLAALEDMILACREALDSPGAEEDELRLALDGLLEDMAGLEETLPLEQAFFADERDRTLRQILGARQILLRKEAAGLWTFLHKVAPETFAQLARTGGLTLPPSATAYPL